MSSEKAGPTSWSADYYALIAEPGTGRFGDQLAVCTIHDEHHIRHGRPGDEMWCQSLPPHRRGPRLSRLRGEPVRPPVRIEVTNVDDVGESIGAGLVLAYRRARREQAPEQRT